MKRKPIDDTLAEIDRLIRAGSLDQARAVLLHVKDRTVPDAARFQFAKFCRRVGLPDVAVRALGPRVRPEGRLAQVTTDDEKVEYAASLVKIGAPEEAFELLQQVGPRIPETLLYEAFALFATWDYARSIPILYQYLECPLSEYQKEVGRANLAAALVHEHDARSSAVLEELIENCRREKHQALMGHGFLLKAEHHFHGREWDKALKDLDQAEVVFPKGGGLESLFIAKWRAFIEMYLNQDLSPLRRVRETAADFKHWETLRDCDRHQAVCFGDRELLLHVYFGTPHEAFKLELLQDFGARVEVPDFYEANLTAPGTPADKALGEIEGAKGNVRLLSILATDFYRPLRVAALHHQLYPGEYFNALSAPLRIRKAVSRLREFLRAGKLPLSVVEDAGAYRLTLAPGFSLRVLRERGVRHPNLELVEKLKAEYREKPFTAREASESLDKNRWTTLVVLKWACAEGLLQLTGKANAARYSFPAKQLPSRRPA